MLRNVWIKALIPVTKLFILSPTYVVCNLFTAHTYTVTAYTNHSLLGTAASI